MPFEKSPLELISLRTSVRSYRDEPLAEALLQRLRDFCEAQTRGPFGGACRFRVLHLPDLARGEARRLGTYGMIRGAGTFIAGVVGPGQRNLEDFGFLMEKIILFATDLGLGTCWLGGTFSRGGFAAQLRPEAGEVLPSATPLGYALEKANPLDRLIRWGAGARRRKPWAEIFFTESFTRPLREEKAGSYAQALEAVRLAPSASNRQPWRILKQEAAQLFHFFLQRTPGYRLLTRVDLQRVDLGIALCHFELAAESLGLKGRWILQAPVLQGRPAALEYVSSWQGGER